jgi:hypothetical protein
MMEVLAQNCQWWDNYREKIFGSAKPVERLCDYGERIYCTDSSVS